MCPLSRNEFEMKSEVELDLRASKVRTWILSFLTEHRDSAYTIRELAEECPSENFKAKVENKDASVNSAMTKLVAGGLVKRKGSYYIRSTGRRKYNKRNGEEKPEKANGKTAKKSKEEERK